MPIVVEKLTHTYMSGSSIAHRAIHDIDLTIHEGEFLGIIGHTGSGKSTLIQHLNGLLLPNSGCVKVDGLNMNEKSERIKGRSLVGMVFQYAEYQLFEETVAKDVGFGPRNMKLSEEEITERVIEALTLVGLAPEIFMDKSPFDLSGGEKRRAALAGVIAMRPKYLVLDEPMAGLDPRGRKAVMELIQTLREKTGCAIVMVSHSMDDIATCADRIAVLYRGELVMLDTPARVFERAQELISMGLDVPQAAQLCVRLKEQGVNVPGGFYRIEDVHNWLRGVLEHAR